MILSHGINSRLSPMPKPSANTLRFGFSNYAYNPIAEGIGTTGTWRKLKYGVWD